VNTTVNSNVCFWPSPAVGSTLYWYNNLAYDVGPCELFNIGQNYSDQGTVSIFNSTFQMNHRTDGGTNSFSCSATGNVDPYTNANIHFISSDVSSIYSGNCSGKGTDTKSLLVTNAAATTAGYTGSQTFAFSPTSAGSPTVGTGANGTGTFCAALATAAATDPTLADAARACQYGTTLGCTYDASTHTMVCPVINPAARPATGAWDVGAYQYLNGVNRIADFGLRTADYINQPKLISPNPIKAAFLYQYLKARQDLTAYDLAGNVIDKNRLTQAGIYLVKQKTSSAFQKVAVVQ
jgi:hypothetical protein